MKRVQTHQPRRSLTHLSQRSADSSSARSTREVSSSGATSSPSGQPIARRRFDRTTRVMGARGSSERRGRRANAAERGGCSGCLRGLSSRSRPASGPMSSGSLAPVRRPWSVVGCSCFRPLPPPVRRCCVDRSSRTVCVVVWCEVVWKAAQVRPGTIGRGWRMAGFRPKGTADSISST